MRPTSRDASSASSWRSGSSRYRDLPLLLNQWANVVRWELRPRVFLRTTEFLWQEGHTAHATSEDAAAYARRILLDVYRDFMVDVLAMPVSSGVKTAARALRRRDQHDDLRGDDGRRQGAADGHQPRAGPELRARLRHRLPRRATATQQHCWTTSWGTLHPHGRRADHVPRRRPRPARAAAARARSRRSCSWCATRTASPARRAASRPSCAAAGVRARVDDNTATGFGRRATDWELKGVPVRVEIGPRDLAEGVVTRRPARPPATKETVPPPASRPPSTDLLDEIQAGLLAEADRRRDARTADVADPRRGDRGRPDRLRPHPVGGRRRRGRGPARRARDHGALPAAPDGGVPDDLEGPLEALVARAY